MSPARSDTRDDIEAHIRATDLGETPGEMRRGFERLAGPQPEGVTRSFGGQDILAADADSDLPPLLFLHGGGYVFGSPRSHMRLADRLARGGVTTLLPRYPLAPEATWPAPLDHILSLVDAHDGPLSIGGISAGGHLALNVALQRPGRFDALVLISPNTDRSGVSDTRHALEDVDLMNDDATDTRLAGMAFPHRAKEDAQVSPLLADLGALPPTRVIVGSDEVLLDDSLHLARRAALHHAPLSLDMIGGLFHMAQLWPDAIDDAGASLDRAAAWLHAAARSRAG